MDVCWFIVTLCFCPILNISEVKKLHSRDFVYIINAELWLHGEKKTSKRSFTFFQNQAVIDVRKVKLYMIQSS